MFRDAPAYKRYLLYALCLLPMIALRDFTPDNELKYLSIADEAIANGSLFTFRNHGVIYADKPPLYFWIIMLSRLLFGGHYMLPLGLFSLLPAIGVVRVMARWTRIDDAGTELMLMSSLYFGAAALVVRMDMLMTFFIILSLQAFWKIYNNSEGASPWLFALFVFMAIFTKGPVGMIIPFAGTTAFLLYRRRMDIWLRAWGWRTWLLLGGLCGAWFAAVWAEGGREYLEELVLHQTVGRAVNAFTHKQPFWYYAPALLYSFFPWSPLAVWLIIKACIKGRLKGDLEQFMIITAGVFLVIMSCVSSKIQVYLVPIYPVIVYLASLMWQDEPAPKLRKVVLNMGSAVIVLAGVAGLLMPLFNDRIGIRALCKDAVEASPADAAFAGYKMRSAANLDAFLGREVKEYDEWSDELRGKTVFINTKRLEWEPELKEKAAGIHTRGSYTYLVIPD